MIYNFIKEQELQKAMSKKQLNGPSVLAEYLLNIDKGIPELVYNLIGQNVKGQISEKKWDLHL